MPCRNWSPIRRDLHAHPELGSKKRGHRLHRRHLEALGYEVTTGLAKTGVVGTLRSGTGVRARSASAPISMRWPIQEETGAAYASTKPA